MEQMHHEKSREKVFAGTKGKKSLALISSAN